MTLNSLFTPIRTVIRQQLLMSTNLDRCLQYVWHSADHFHPLDPCFDNSCYNFHRSKLYFVNQWIIHQWKKKQMFIVLPPSNRSIWQSTAFIYHEINHYRSKQYESMEFHILSTYTPFFRFADVLLYVMRVWIRICIWIRIQGVQPKNIY